MIFETLHRHGNHRFKAKFKIKSPKINRGTLIVRLLNSLENIKDTNGGELLLTANCPKY